MKSSESFIFNGITFDVTYGKSETVRHGGPFDRGSADSYYNKSDQPHYYTGNTGSSDRVEKDQMTKREILEYYAGFEYNETVNMDWKEW